MTPFYLFSAFLFAAVCLLVIWPIFLHPTLPRRRKLVMASVLFLLLVPGGIALYAWLGVPTMAAL